MIGGRSPYLQPHHFQLSVGYRGGISPRHWTGLVRNHEIRSGVRNYQSIVDVIGTYQINRQAQVSLSLPWVFSNRRFLFGPVPTTRIAAFRPLLRDGLKNRNRWFTPYNGIGDMSLVVRSWLFPTKRFLKGNLSLGFGLQFPTGRWDGKALFPENMIAPVDISIQPGAGGLGLIGEVQGFKQIGNITAYGAATYIALPRNATSTILNGVYRNPQSAVRGYLTGTGLGPAITNSVPDQYFGEMGLAIRIPKIRGLYLLTSARIEGSPPRDFIGGFAGFRRPGFELFAVPGIGYTRGRNNLQISVPVRCVINVMNAPATPRVEDSTFPDWLVLARYTRTF